MMQKTNEMRKDDRMRAFIGMVAVVCFVSCTTSERHTREESEVLVAPLSGMQVYYGDIHTHGTYSFDGCDQAGNDVDPTPEHIHDMLTYARDTANLDFVAITDHAEGISVSDLDTQVSVATTYDSSSFVPFIGYEWTSRDWGHRTVVFRDLDSGMPLYSAQTTSDVQTLWSNLESDGYANKVFTLPHHPAGVPDSVDWSVHSETFQPLVEIYGQWGSSEDCGAFDTIGGCNSTRTVQAALSLGYRLGIYASTDSHDSQPGSVNDGETCGSYSSNGGGLIAVWASSLSRSNIWEAMQQRRVFGTSGPRMVLDFTINDQPLGSDITSSTDPVIAVNATPDGGTITTIEIIRNGVVDHTCVDTPTCNYTDTDCIGNTYYYARAIQSSGDRAWSSPIWVECESDCIPSEEICDDGLDNDCDGLIDEGCEPVCLERGETCTSHSDCCSERCRGRNTKTCR